MTARKSGNHIYIEDSGNTLSSVTADIADSTFIEETAPGVFTVKENVNRYFYIRPGGTLTIGDPLNYSIAETLQFDTNTANYGRFYINNGGVLLQYGNTVLNFSSGSQRSSYAYIYGQVNVIGDDTYKPIWQNYQRIYFYENNTGTSYPNDIWHFEKMILGSGFAANYYGFFFSSIGRMRKHIFKDITFDDRVGNGGATNMFYFSHSYPGSHQVTFENLNFAHARYPIINYGSPVHLKNCTFDYTITYKSYNYNPMRPVSNKHHYDTDITNEPQYGQCFMFYDGCTFTASDYAHSILTGYSANVLVKDCDFQRTASGYYLYAQYDGRIMRWTGNTEAKTSGQYAVNSTGAIQWVHGLGVLVQDADGNPIEGALVECRQSEDKERWVFLTDVTGHLINYHDVGVALLTWKHQYGSNVATQSELWSDTSNGTYHIITASKDGYDTISETTVMDAEKSLTLTMELDEKVIGSVDSITTDIVENVVIGTIIENAIAASIDEDVIAIDVMDNEV